MHQVYDSISKFYVIDYLTQNASGPYVSAMYAFPHKLCTCVAVSKDSLVPYFTPVRTVAQLINYLLEQSSPLLTFSKTRRLTYKQMVKEPVAMLFI